MKKHFITALIIGLCASPSIATADNSQTFGAYTIHYNALSTQSLSPDIAKAYGIRRSKNRGMINVAVRKKLEDGSEIPVTAKVAAHARNIHAQIKDLDPKQIKEEQAIYYIADFKVEDHENLKFKLNVTPEGAPQRTVEFSQSFFTD